MSGVSLPRRRLLRVLLTASGGLAVGFAPCAGAAEAAPPEAPAEAPAAPWAGPVPGIALGPWLIIEPDQSILVRVPKSEMGQGVL
ncbi:MAG: hypothetical protein ACREF0_16660, partial [Acetobacteraceae bacterium]